MGLYQGHQKENSILELRDAYMANGDYRIYNLPPGHTAEYYAGWHFGVTLADDEHDE